MLGTFDFLFQVLDPFLTPPTLENQRFIENISPIQVGADAKTAPGRAGPGRPAKSSKKCIPGPGPEK